MPKTKNLGKLKDRFEVRGGVINEFDFHQGQKEFAEEERSRLEQREGQGAPEGQPQSEAERVALLMEEAHQKVEKKKSAARKGKGGAKKAAKKSAAKKSGGKKGAAGKGGAKKGAAKKGAGKKSAAKKSSARKRAGK